MVSTASHILTAGCIFLLYYGRGFVMPGFIEKCLDEIYAEIPEEILNLAFINDPAFGIYRNVSLDSMIREQIIERRIRPDFDLKGVTQEAIPLSGIQPIIVDQYRYIFKIPFERTQGRVIISSLEVSFGKTSMYNGNLHSMVGTNYAQNSSYGRTPLSDALSNQLHSAGPIPPVSTTNTRIIAENTVLVNDYLNSWNELFLHCFLGSDSEFSQITPPYYIAFSEAVVLATKSYCYRKLNINLDRAALIGGQALGRIRDVLDEYRDAEQTYKDFRKELLGKLLHLNDPKRMTDTISLLLGGNL